MMCNEIFNWWFDVGKGSFCDYVVFIVFVLLCFELFEFRNIFFVIMLEFFLYFDVWCDYEYFLIFYF